MFYLSHILEKEGLMEVPNLWFMKVNVGVGVIKQKNLSKPTLYYLHPMQVGVITSWRIWLGNWK